MLDKKLTLDEVLEILQLEGITTHIDSVRRWIRTGKIKATINSKKEGYRVTIGDLLDFIEEKLSSERFKKVKQKFKSELEEEQLSLGELEFRKNFFRLEDIRRKMHALQWDEGDAKQTKEMESLKKEMREIFKDMQAHLDTKLKEGE